MRRTTSSLLAALLVAVAAPVGAQATVGPDSPPIGDWTGTSLCLQGKPTCKDEDVVYHIATRAASTSDSAGTDAVPLRMKANKLVNGVEEDMGDLDCTWVGSKRALTCPMPPQYAKGEWRFARDGERLTGGLWLDARGKVRVVEVQHRAAPSHAHQGGR